MTLYIIGAGRSGSTVLDTVLGNHPRLESVGELINVARSGWLNNEYCACGQRANDCPYWNAVRQEWATRIGRDDPSAYRNLQLSFERLRNWPTLWRRNDSAFQQYADQTLALYQSIRAVSGKTMIVDSSKQGSRAYALSKIAGLELRLLHLVRDGRGVAWSLQKSYQKDERAGVQRHIPPRPIWRTALFWLLSNIQAGWLRRRLPPAQSHRVRYEDFVTQPAQVLTDLGGWLGLDFEPVLTALNQGTALPVGHTIAGNRVRMAGQIRLKPDTEWQECMPARDRRIFELLAGWQLRQYGYR